MDDQLSISVLIVSLVPPVRRYGRGGFNMVSSVQQSFNWPIAMYLFWEGRRGLFFTGYVLEQLDLMVLWAKGAASPGSGLVIIGCIFLLFHAGAGFKTKIYLLFLKPVKSWISRGTWIISVFVASTLVYMLREEILPGRSVAVVFSLLMAFIRALFWPAIRRFPLEDTSLAGPVSFFRA